MRAPFTQLYLHCVWATWDRLPLVVAQIEQAAYAAIRAKCAELRCVPIAIGGIPDHVHLLARLPTTLSVAELVQGVKGASSHLITHEVSPGEFFKWQGGYGAFTVSKDAVPAVEQYIQNQKEHHTGGRAFDEWERTTDRADRDVMLDD